MQRKRTVLGIQVSPGTMDSVKRQARQRSAREDRCISLSDLIREALTAYGIDLVDPAAQSAATSPPQQRNDRQTQRG